MKKTVLCLMIALFLSLPLFLVGCPAHEPTPEEDMAAIVEMMNTEGEETSVEELFALFSSFEFDMYDMTVNGVKLDDFRFAIKDAAMYAHTGEEVSYFFLSPSDATMTMDHRPQYEQLLTGLITHGRVLEEEDAPSEEAPTTPEFPLAEVGDLVDEGNRVYSFSHEYITEALEALMEYILVEVDEEMSSADKRNFMALFMDYARDMDIRLAYTMGGKGIAGMEIRIDLDSDLCADIFETLIDLPAAALDEEYKISLSLNCTADGEELAFASLYCEIDIPVVFEQGYGNSYVGFLAANCSATFDGAKLSGSADAWANASGAMMLTTKVYNAKDGVFVLNETDTKEAAKSDLASSFTFRAMGDSTVYLKTVEQTTTEETITMVEAKYSTRDVEFPSGGEKGEKYKKIYDNYIANKDAVDTHALDAKAKLEAAIALPENAYVKYGFPVIAYYYEEYGLYFYYMADQAGKLIEFPEYYLQLDDTPEYTATIDGDTVTFQHYYG